ncbi:MAG: SURF1 family protein [Methylotenera sp.]|uniref:SURF1 family protein n=1 Tax=Methylotenera sp. TaxID=2051956 RepID=UPI002489332E|nr:SURF1 family protein [Methylotenera sp.]MDI1309686.1 SURF1 family protein [Methylotenera sp.]
MKQMQFRMHRYVFQPTALGIAITLLCIPLFIKLGLWQYSKAQQKQLIHEAYDQAKLDKALEFPLGITDSSANHVNDWKYKKVSVQGVYDTNYQFLLDNQVEGDRVGYHVITPLKIDNSNEYVLVNRGWILGKDTHTELPVFNTPEGKQTLTGQIWVPSKKIFTLEGPVDSSEVSAQLGNQHWQPVWQNISMEKYKRSVPFNVSELAIKLDQESTAGGFVRNWQIPADRITNNLGYAYQWFGFAFAALLIFFYISTTKVRPENNSATG